MALDARSARLQAAREEELLRGRPYAVIRAMRSTVTELWSDKAGMFGVLVMLVMFAMAIFAPLIAPYPPDAQSLFDRLQGPSWDHPMGTDQLGRDVLSRVIYGSRISLEVAVSVPVFWLGAAAIVFSFSFFGFLASRFPFCSPLAISISFGLMVTPSLHAEFHIVA